MVMEDPRQPRKLSDAADPVAETGYPGGVMNSGLNANSTVTPSLRVREATPAKDDLDDDLQRPSNMSSADDDEDEDEAEADDESSSVSVPRSTPRFSPRLSRERRHSTVVNPYPMLAAMPAMHSQVGAPPQPVEPLTASAIPSHLDLSEPVKRRSKSTTGPISVSPPSKALRSGELEDLPLRPYHYLQHYHHHHNRPLSTNIEPSSSPQPNFYARPPLGGLSYTSPRDAAASRHHSVSGAHHRPRFRGSGDDYGAGGRSEAIGSLMRYPYSNLIAPTGIRSAIPPVPPGTVPGTVPGVGGGGGRVYRQCPHKIAEENHDPAKWEKNGGGGGGGKESEGGGGGGPGVDGQQQPVVQRTHSNPEMECCPLCMARNQCEILVRRTYSKVAERLPVQGEVA